MDNFSIEKEIWKDIPDFEGLYQASDKGRVRSLDRVIWNKASNAFQSLKGKMLKPVDNGDYWYVDLRNVDKNRRVSVHRLVAETFLRNSEKLEYVNHKDEDKRNNRLENLEWCTHSENTQHAYDTGLMEVDLEQLKEAQNRSVKSTSKPVLQISSEGTVVNEFSSIRQASLHMGVQSCNMIGDVCRGKRKTYKGYKWEFAK